MKGKANLARVIFGILVIAGLSACASGPEKVQVTATDIEFSEMEWTFPAGEEVELTLVNNGALEHEWVLIKQGEKVTPPFDDEDESKIFWEIEAEPGQTATGTFTAPAEPGEYEVVCGVPGHYEAGMIGKATVQ